jgi:site-specific recombinase XerD
VPDSRLHAARHTAASMLLATGSKIEEVQELLGHADIRTTKGYGDVVQEIKQQAVSRVAEVLLNGDLAALLQASAASRTPPR